MSRSNEGIGVTWITGDNYFDRFFGMLIKRFSLCLKYLCIFLKQVTALHARASWLCSNQKRYVCILEAFIIIKGGHNARNLLVC